LGISVRRQKVLPEGTPIDALIKDAEQVMGQFSPQIRIDLKVINGPHAGYEFSDYLKLHVDEETGEVFVKEGGKCWETIVASLGEAGADEFEEASELKGAEITARASLRGKARKYNGLEFGSIGPYIPPKKRKKAQKDLEEQNARDLEEAEISDEEIDSIADNAWVKKEESAQA
jgi:hypothetical protein